MATSSPTLGTLSSYVVSSPKLSPFTCAPLNDNSYSVLARALSAWVTQEPHGGTPQLAPLPPLSFSKSCTKRQLFSPKRKGDPFPHAT
jgi:hypothetical protein